MSVRVMGRVFEQSEATGAARLVLLTIADAAGDDGIAWPSVENLAEKSRMVRSSVFRAVDQLAAAGELDVRKVRRGRSTINVYRVLVGGVQDVDPRRLPAEIAAMFPPSDPATVTVDDHRPISRHSPSDPATAGVSLVQEGKEEPSENRPISRDDPPTVVKVDGRDLPFDALVEVCGMSPESQRLPEVVVALNGPKGQPSRGLRRIYWAELVRWAGDAERRLEHLRAMTSDPAEFAEYLAKAIRRRGALYKEQMPGARCTPGALRNWFLDLEPGGTSPEGSGTFDWGDAG